MNVRARARGNADIPVNLPEINSAKIFAKSPGKGRYANFVTMATKYPRVHASELVQNFAQVESGRVAIGEAVEAELKAMGERRGRPKQEGEGQGELVDADIRRNFDEYPKGRADELAAKKSGFGNKDTYRRQVDERRCIIPTVAGERPVIIFLLHS